MRRRFKLQLASVNPELRKPALPRDVTRDEVRQVMFANLRRRVVIDCEDPFAESGVVSPRLYNGFVAGWLMDCGMTGDHKVQATRCDECPCNYCQDDTGSRPWRGSYHLHWNRSPGSWTSVGVLRRTASTEQMYNVVRTWKCADILKEDSDYTLAINMALDDSLHDAALRDLTDDQLRQRIISEVEDIVVMHAADGITVSDVLPSIERLESGAIKVGCIVELGYETDDLEIGAIWTVSGVRFIRSDQR